MNNRGLPGEIGSGHGIEDGEQLAHAGGESELGSLAGGGKSSVENTDNGIPANGREGGHVEGLAETGSSAPDAPPTPKRAAIAVVGGHAHQGSDLLAIELTQLGQLTQQCSRQDRADAGGTLEQVIGGSPEGAGLDEVTQAALQIPELVLQEGDVAADLVLDATPGVGQPMAFGTEHVADLAAAGQQCLELRGTVIRH